ncbi:MAG: hypothetical protein IT447_08525 [Phycisphaerales bacterium]|nr:hypothetical protein [Phycisphaerales bacterium]
MMTRVFLMLAGLACVLAAAAPGGAPNTYIIEDGRQDPDKYYDERPKVLDQSHTMVTEGKTSIHFQSGSGAGRMLLTKFKWPQEVDFSTIAADGTVRFSLWIDDPSRIRSSEMGDRLEFCIGSRTNDKFAYWYVPAALLQPRIWNQISLALRDGRPNLEDSTVNGSSLSKDKNSAVVGTDIDWQHVNYHRWSIPFSDSMEGYLDNVVATADVSATSQPVSLTEHELDPMPGCPDFDTDRITPPDVSKEAFFGHPDIDFTRIKGWTAQFVGGTGQFYLSKRQAIRGIPNARLEMNADRTGRIVLTPPEPVVVDHPFDTVEAWVYGAYHEGVALKINFQDPSGQTFSIAGGNEQYAPGGLIFSNWTLYRKRNPAKLTAPAGTRITSIEIGPIPSGSYLFTLDQLQLTRFDLSQEPAPSFPHAGPEIQIPVTADGSCPITRSEIQTRTYQDHDRFILEYQPKDQSPTVRYVLSPRTGTMTDLSVEIVGRGTFRPAVDSGPVIVQGANMLDPTHDPNIPRQLLSANLNEQALAVSWAYGPPGSQTIIDYQFQLMGKTLAVSASSHTPTVSRWFYGHADGLEKPKVIESPYRKYDANFLFDRGMFLSYLPDWYFSNSSHTPWMNVNRIEGDKAWFGWAEDTGGEYGYLPRTDGNRWPFKERFYISVSNHYDEILPTVNNPKSPMKETLRKYVWLMVSNRGDQFPLVKQYIQQCIDLGMTNTYFMWHAPLWSNRGGRGPEPFIGRMKVSEKFDDQGGTEAVVEFYNMLRQNGFRTGYYEGYCFMEPVASFFHRDWLGYDSNGDWLPLWVQSYKPKPQAFAEYAATTSKERQQKFGADVVYMDGWTASLAFEFNDYDARYLESGKTITTLRDIARGFRNLRQTFNGPAFTEGSGRHYREAGLVDGSYGQTYDQDRKKPTPLFVDFQLLKTHPLGGDLGMGCCRYMFTPGPNPTAQDVYDFVASEIAFGNIGLQEPYAYLSIEPKIFDQSLLTYFMVQQLQQYYVMEPVAQIRYFDGQTLLDTDRAIATNAHLLSQVYIRYQNGLEIWVNCHPEGKPWTIRNNDQTFVLPKGGWLARMGDELLEFSALIDGRRVDYVNGPDYTYVNPSGHAFEFAGESYPAGQATILHKKGALAGKQLHWPNPTPTTSSH